MMAEMFLKYDICLAFDWQNGTTFMADKTLYYRNLWSFIWPLIFENLGWFLMSVSQLQLKETTERILAVDRAAAMIEEMMKQKTNSQVGLVGSQTVKVDSSVWHFLSIIMKSGQQWTQLCLQMLNTCVYLGFEADPSSNVAARIRGPNVSLLSISYYPFFNFKFTSKELNLQSYIK